MCKPKQLSPGEEALSWHLTCHGITFEREYRPSTVRRWRLDFAWPVHKLGVEVHGGVWKRGRHSGGTGQESDFEKMNWMALNGWRILQYSTQMVIRGDAIADIQAALGSTEPV